MEENKDVEVDVEVEVESAVSVDEILKCNEELELKIKNNNEEIERIKSEEAKLKGVNCKTTVLRNSKRLELLNNEQEKLRKDTVSKIRRLVSSYWEKTEHNSVEIFKCLDVLHGHKEDVDMSLYTDEEKILINSAFAGRYFKMSEMSLKLLLALIFTNEGNDVGYVLKHFNGLSFLEQPKLNSWIKK